MSGVAYAFGPVEGPPVLPQGHAPQIVGGCHRVHRGAGRADRTPRRVNRVRAGRYQCAGSPSLLRGDTAAGLRARAVRSRRGGRQPVFPGLSAVDLPGERRLDRRHRADPAAMAARCAI